MMLLGIIAIVGASFTAGRLYENRRQEQMMKRARRRKAAKRYAQHQQMKDVQFFATVKADAPGEWR